MQDKYSQTHATLARTIRTAKKQMLKRHREGENLNDAGQWFTDTVLDTINELFHFERGGTAEELGRPQKPCAQTLPNSPMAREVGGYRVLDDVERNHLCEMLAEDAGGEVFVGYMILLLEHLVAVHLQNNMPLEGEVLNISGRLLAANSYAIDSARSGLTKRSIASMTQAISELGLRGGAAQ